MDGTQQKLSNEKIEEALKLLSEAAREKKSELLTMMADRYTDLKDTLYEGESRFGHAVSDASHRARERVTHAGHVGQERAREMAMRIDENVHASPWSYISGIAIGALILGYMLGRKD